MKIAVIGIGTAGIQTLCYLLGHLPDAIEIYSIHDPDTKILGIGESTTTALPYALRTGAGFTMLDDGDELETTVKHGVRYENWTKDHWHTHILPPQFAMHFNNFKLGEVILPKLKTRWGSRFQTIEGKILDISQDNESVQITINETTHLFDYLIDCGGYPEDYADYEIRTDLPVNHCLVHTINEPGTWNFTYHKAHRNGWMFGIPLKTRQGWGYLYNDTITTKEDAMKEIAELFDTDVNTLNLREFSFKNYFAKEIINGRIIKNGNRALFFEPLEALSGYFYDAVCVAIVNLLMNGYSKKELNTHLTETALKYENFICAVYHKGSVYDTEFWRITKEKTKNHLDNSPLWREHLRIYKLFNHLNFGEEVVLPPVSIHLWHILNDELRIFNDK